MLVWGSVHFSTEEWGLVPASNPAQKGTPHVWKQKPTNSTTRRTGTFSKYSLQEKKRDPHDCLVGPSVSPVFLVPKSPDTQKLPYEHLTCMAEVYRDDIRAA